jgi:competence ComEA-like helix-hairpin-helix protein
MKQSRRLLALLLVSLIVLPAAAKAPRKKTVWVRLKGTHYSGRLNINTAAERQLIALPEIGPELARAILRRRQEQGPFTSLDQLLPLRGIGAARLERLRLYLKLAGESDFQRLRR